MAARSELRGLPDLRAQPALFNLLFDFPGGWGCVVVAASLRGSAAPATQTTPDAPCQGNPTRPRAAGSWLSIAFACGTKTMAADLTRREPVRRSTTTLILLLAALGWADEKPSKALKQAVKVTARAASWSLEMAVVAGIADGPEHQPAPKDVALAYHWQRVAELVAFSEPEAYRLFGRDGGAISDPGHGWLALNQTHQGRVLAGVARSLPEVLAGLLELQRSASWLADAEDGGKRLQLSAPVAVARERLAALQRAGAFEDEEQLKNATSGDDGDFAWKSPPSLERIDRSRGQLSIVVSLDPSNGMVREIEQTLLFAVRGTDGLPLQEALSNAEHVVARTHIVVTDHDRLDTPIVLPPEISRLMR